MFKSIFMAGIIGVATATHVEAEILRVYNWSDYIDKSLLEKFERETGIGLIYDEFDSNQDLETKLRAGESGYDVVVLTGPFLQRLITAGAFQKLDFSKLPNHENMWNVVASHTATYDPDNAYSINYMWGTTGIGVNVGKVTEVLGPDAPIDSLSLIFDPANMEKLAECGVHFLDSPNEMIPAALAYLGERPDNHNINIIAKAEPVLMAVSPFVEKFHNSDYTDALANGDICVAVGWSGGVLQARNRAAKAGNGVEIAYNVVIEGSPMWFDQMAIPADAPTPDAAHKFLNFIMDAQNIAAASNYVFFANGNLASQEFLDAEVINDPAIYPTLQALSMLFTVKPYSAKEQRAVSQMWIKIKSGT